VVSPQFEKQTLYVVLGVLENETKMDTDSPIRKAVAELFTERTGVDMTAEAAAIRHNML
jgi:hypothetical protein